MSKKITPPEVDKTQHCIDMALQPWYRKVQYYLHRHLGTPDKEWFPLAGIIVVCEVINTVCNIITINRLP